MIEIVFLLLCAHAYDPLSTMVVQLQEHNFDKLVFSGDGVWFVKFYAPWCGHCKKLQPIWEELAEEADKDHPSIKYGAVDCTTSSKICTKHDVTGYPHLLLFDSATGRSKKYSNSRNKNEISKFALAGFPVEDKKATEEAAKKDANAGSVVVPPQKALGVKPPLPGFEKEDAEKKAQEEKEAKERVDPRFFWLNFGPATHYCGPTRHVQNLYFIGIPLILFIYIGLRVFSGGPRRVEDTKKND